MTTHPTPRRSSVTTRALGFAAALSIVLTVVLVRIGMMAMAPSGRAAFALAAVLGTIALALTLRFVVRLGTRDPGRPE